MPRLHVADFEGYTSEEQAAEYPAGQYELALQVAGKLADAYRDGIWFVDLAPLTNPSLVPQAVARAAHPSPT